MDNPWALVIGVVLAGLANYKAAHMLSQDGDDGPFDIFKRWRAWVTARMGAEHWVARGFHCFSCTSFWGALIAALLLWPGVPFGQFLLVWGAIATLSVIVWRYFG
jgi:hypothetical protein